MSLKCRYALTNYNKTHYANGSMELNGTSWLLSIASSILRNTDCTPMATSRFS